jgi:hypothetical protein
MTPRGGWNLGLPGRTRRHFHKGIDRPMDILKGFGSIRSPGHKTDDWQTANLRGRSTPGKNQRQYGFLKKNPHKKIERQAQGSRFEKEPQRRRHVPANHPSGQGRRRRWAAPSSSRSDHVAQAWDRAGLGSAVWNSLPISGEFWAAMKFSCPHGIWRLRQEQRPDLAPQGRLATILRFPINGLS